MSTPLYGLYSDGELFFVDRASRAAGVPSFGAFVREVLLRHAENVLGPPLRPFPDRIELPDEEALRAASPKPKGMEECRLTVVE